MADKHRQRLERHLDGFQGWLPGRVSDWLAWLRQPSARAVRIPAGVILICGSFLAILPVFGVWMAPVGVILLALDVPALQRPTGRALVRARLLWNRWRKRRPDGA